MRTLFVLALSLFVMSPIAYAQAPGPISVISYPPNGKVIRGTGSATTTAAANISNFTAVANTFNHVIGVQCFRTDAGTTAIYVTLNDTASTVIGLPNAGNGGGNNATYLVPLLTAVNTQLTFTESATTATVYCNAQGWQSLSQ